MDLLDKINEITANSVTPEEFKKATGHTIDEHVANMMDRIQELEGKKVAEVRPIANKTGRRAAARPAALPAAAAKPAAIEDERKETASSLEDFSARVAKAVKAGKMLLKAPKGRKKVWTVEELLEANDIKKDMFPISVDSKGMITIDKVTVKKILEIVEPVKGSDVISLNITELLGVPSQSGRSGRRQARKGPKGGGPAGGGPK